MWKLADVQWSVTKQASDLVVHVLVNSSTWTQHIEDGYERNMLTGAGFVDLSPTVQRRLMIIKLMDMTCDIDLCRVVKGVGHHGHV